MQQQLLRRRRRTRPSPPPQPTTLLLLLPLLRLFQRMLQQARSLPLSPLRMLLPPHLLPLLPRAAAPPAQPALLLL